MKKEFAIISFLIIVLNLTACSTIGYYSQSISGQFEVLTKSRPIPELINDEKTEEVLKRKLNLVLEIREFASVDLELPDNGSYLKYADLNREYVIWNVISTPRLSLYPKTWCYLVVGCLDYRGYFSKEDAINLKHRLEKENFDVFVSGVAAYSTLGWFKDPVLNTMLFWDEVKLAEVIFHELAHQQLYIKNDTAFNEAYAETIALIGIRRWLNDHGTTEQTEKFERQIIQENVFLDLVMDYKKRFALLYESSIDEEIMITRKAALFDQMRSDFKERSSDWTENPYQDWFTNGLNNAKLAAVVTYRELVPAMLSIFESLGQNLPAFLARMKSLSKCSQNQRKERLKDAGKIIDC